MPRTTFEFTNGLGQAVYHKCAPSRPRSEWVPDQGQFLLGCAWNNCYGSNECKCRELGSLLKARGVIL